VVPAPARPQAPQALSLQLRLQSRKQGDDRAIGKRWCIDDCRLRLCLLLGEFLTQAIRWLELLVLGTLYL
jgi:hypothetical protein